MKTMKSICLYILSITLLVGACSKKDNKEDEIANMIQEVKNVTAAFKSIDAAILAGWDTDLSGCVEHPTEGGMGHHYARLAFIDGRVNHLEPQVLLYAMNAMGEMEFLGVEYVVPFDFVSADDEPPILFSHEFHANHEQGFWALHVWTEKDNPKGMFYDWNPTVSCPDVDED